jgi:hypothetical protein
LDWCVAPLRLVALNGLGRRGLEAEALVVEALVVEALVVEVVDALCRQHECDEEI